MSICGPNKRKVDPSATTKEEGLEAIVDVSIANQELDGRGTE